MGDRVVCASDHVTLCQDGRVAIERGGRWRWYGPGSEASRRRLCAVLMDGVARGDLAAYLCENQSGPGFLVAFWWRLVVR